MYKFEKIYDCAKNVYDYSNTNGEKCVIMKVTPKFIFRRQIKMSGRICIPDYEYKERIAKAAKLIREKGLDVMVVCSTESDYANARYFSGFWPLFE